MKTKVTILLGALLCAGPLIAQAPGPDQPTSAQRAQTPSENRQLDRDPAKQAAHLGKQLGLSKEQVTQITPILADRQQQLQSLRADASLRPRVRRNKAKEILKDSTAKIEAILNDTQKQQYEQLTADRRSHRNRQPQG
jgi:periplasmic protein CpxP/Spy